MKPAIEAKRLGKSVRPILAARRSAKQRGNVAAPTVTYLLEMSSAGPRQPAEAPDTDTGQQRTALMSVFAAAALVVLKLGTGLVAGSLGLVSAGIESSGDVVA